jgi:hypothetical protein
VAAKELKYTADAAEPLVIKLKYALCTYSVCCMPQRSEPTALRCTLSDRCDRISRYTASRRQVLALLCTALHCSALLCRSDYIKSKQEERKDRLQKRKAVTPTCRHAAALNHSESKSHALRC